ncbi:MAG: translation initiation factor IF-2 [Clostridia bacterium]|nr:translation initiation factor IF-2 [Clostridia bacterium]
MAKVNVQDTAKELNESVGSLLERMSKMRRQAQLKYDSMRRASDEFRRKAQETAQPQVQYADSVQFMSAYSSEQVPRIPDKPEPAEETGREARPAAVPETRQEEERTPVQEAPAPAAPVQTEARAPERTFPTAGRDDAGRPARTEGVRPAQPGQPGAQRAPYSRPAAQPGQPGAQRAPYNRPAQPGQPGAQRPPYNRPAQPGQPGAQRPPYNRPAQPGQPGAQRQGGFVRNPQGGQGAPRTGGFGRSRMPDLTPSVEKERVSNYDPNKKQYVRQNDPERAATRSRKRDSASMNTGYDDEVVRGKRKKKPVQKKAAITPIKIETAVMTAEKITVRDLTERLGKPAGEIIKKLMMLGIIATINEELDYDTAVLVADEFGIKLELKLAETAEDALEKEDVADTEEDMEPRPPVITIMGHVDHGKTSLLDYIRSSRVTASEAGGITQHIGAYTVDVQGRQITFLDTPGHEAFTSMRMRGAQATDIAILVVAADDGVMPQTVEAINHAKAAGVQIIVAINKIDKVGANPERIKEQLTEYDLVCEEWGGSTIMVPVSAVTGEGVEQLLEMILLVADMEDYRANPNRKARGIIIEARLDKGRGPVATVLVKNGTLNVGDTIVSGTAYGRVRAMVNDRGERVKSAGPSDPVEVIGFNDVPEAGEVLNAVDDDKLSRQVAEERKAKQRVALIKEQQQTTLDDLFSQITAGQIKDLNLIIKADVQGSVEAVRQSLEKLSNDEVRVRTIHGAVGAITETDVMLASTANAIIIGFNVRPDANARAMAEREKIDIRLYRIIYQAIEDVEKAMKGLLAPTFREVLLGHAEVRQTFRVSGVGTIAGSYVTDGKIARNAQIRLLRDNIVIHEGKIDSLKRFKDDAREVNSGYECGIGIAGYNDIKEGDVIECFVMEEVEK